MNPTYSVKQLAKLAGVSVRTLHVYDKLGLLKPSVRTRANYRQYRQEELLRLQQILFYKELDIPLKAIKTLLDEPGFDLEKALNDHHAALTQRKARLDKLLHTIENTLFHLNNKTMDTKVLETLFEGLPAAQAQAWRKDAMKNWGEENVRNAEKALLDMPPADLAQLKRDQREIRQQLAAIQQEDPHSTAVQEVIGRHYANIRGFWGLTPADGPKTERYKGLADLYVTDNRYLGDRELALFVRAAMFHFAETQLC